MAQYEELFNFLAMRSPESELRNADLIVGFGHFDPKVPGTCCDLYRGGIAPRILFTGGTGAGTADLSVPEAVFYEREARLIAPEMPDDAVYTEARSTNTAENLLFSEELLREKQPNSTFACGIRRAVLVANAYRQRRVWLTLRKHFPSVTGVNWPPRTGYAEEKQMFARKGQDLDKLLRGELQRILEYPKKGFIAPCDIPPELTAMAAG